MDPTSYGALIDSYAASGAISTIISLAKDVGVLDILYNSDDALTSLQIADKGQLKERYVREMLGGLVCGKVVQVDSTSSLFSISPQLKPVLKQKSIMTQYTPYMGQKYDAIKNCFPVDNPGGVRFGDYPGIFKIMDELLQANQDRLLDRDILPSYPDLENQLNSGIEVAEIGCANGTLMLNLCKRFPKSRFCGSDVDTSVLENAKEKGAAMGLNNCEFMIINVCTGNDHPKDRFDWMYVRDVIHDLPDPAGAMSRIYEMLKPGGVFSMVDFGLTGTLASQVGNGEAGFLYSASTFICIPESFQAQNSKALGPCWGVETTREIIASVGFSLINEHRSEWNGSETTYVCQKPLQCPSVKSTTS